MQKFQNRGMKEDKYAKILAKRQVCAVFHMPDIRKWRRDVGVRSRAQIWPPETNKNICFRAFLLMREFIA